MATAPRPVMEALAAYHRACQPLHALAEAILRAERRQGDSLTGRSDRTPTQAANDLSESRRALLFAEDRAQRSDDVLRSMIRLHRSEWLSAAVEAEPTIWEALIEAAGRSDGAAKAHAASALGVAWRVDKDDPAPQLRLRAAGSAARAADLACLQAMRPPARLAGRHVESWHTGGLQERREALFEARLGELL